jgi:hypothetical protein
MSIQTEFLSKVALGGDIIGKIEEHIPMLVGIPLALGVASGALASKASSPQRSDVEAIQDNIMDTTIDSQLAQRRRMIAIMQQLKAQNEEIRGRRRKRDAYLA